MVDPQFRTFVTVFSFLFYRKALFVRPTLFSNFVTATRIEIHWKNHCVKSVHIRSYSGLYFPAFRLNSERYSVSLRIQAECRKYGPEQLRIRTLFMQWIASEKLSFQTFTFWIRVTKSALTRATKLRTKVSLASPFYSHNYA